MNYGVIVAAGKSERMGPDVDKAFLSLGTKPVLAYSLIAFEKCPDIDGVILVVRKDRVDSARAMVQLFGCYKVRKVIAGGATRQISVKIGLSQLNHDVSIVAVHDGARPCITPLIISETVKSARKFGSGVAAVKITDTVKEVKKGFIVSKTIDRTMLWAVQTPQTFRVDLLTKAFNVVSRKRLTVTDEASAVELVSRDVRLVPTALSNIKITVPDDLILAAAVLRL
ncbi:MAG: 2-C-methyl-D-erythritol 4-phosphate cytidylyltransferase [Kiritimatiellae bacterium]|nr:2-C-methyl-D-erythritol 4-phosphate cytidylyltransferase [Kiritimatiellia bacterium]MDD5521470.1 2-C-methyl-D-erythritol 4-phosphate cytidylyltransferase [Kiritimatiellia bacterium]